MDPANTTDLPIAGMLAHVKAGFVFTILMTILSIFGAIGILTSYIICPKERNTIRQLLLVLTLADSLAALSNFSGSVHFLTLIQVQNITVDIKSDFVTDSSNKSATLNGNIITTVEWCVIQSFVGTSADLVSYFYNIVIAGYFYTVASIKSETTLLKKLGWVHLICWSVPCVIVTIAACCNALGADDVDRIGYTGPWCWISGNMPWQQRLTWLVVTGQGWVFITYILCPVFWSLVFYEMYKHRPRSGSQRLAWINIKIGSDHPKMHFREEDWNYRFIPFTFYLLHMWGSIRFVMSAVEMSHAPMAYIPDGVLRWLYVMQCIGESSQGFVNFIVFCVIDRRIRTRMCGYVCDNRGVSKSETETETRQILRFRPDNSGLRII